MATYLFIKLSDSNNVIEKSMYEMMMIKWRNFIFFRILFLSFFHVTLKYPNVFSPLLHRHGNSKPYGYFIWKHVVSDLLQKLSKCCAYSFPKSIKKMKKKKNGEEIQKNIVKEDNFFLLELKWWMLQKYLQL